MRSTKSRECGTEFRDLAQEQPCSGQVPLVRRVSQQVDRLLVSGDLFLRGVSKAQASVRGLVGEQQPVAERKLTALIVPEHNVGELMCKDNSQAGFIRQYIH